MHTHGSQKHSFWHYNDTTSSFKYEKTQNRSMASKNMDGHAVKSAGEILKEFKEASVSVLRIKANGKSSENDFTPIFSELSTQIKSLVRDIDEDSDIRTGEAEKFNKANANYLDKTPTSVEDSKELLSKHADKIYGSAYEKAIERVSKLTEGLKELSKIPGDAMAAPETIYSNITKALNDILAPYSDNKQNDNLETLISGLPQKEALMAKDLNRIKKVALVEPILGSLDKLISEKAIPEKLNVPEFLKRRKGEGTNILDITESIADKKAVEEAAKSRRAAGTHSMDAEGMQQVDESKIPTLTEVVAEPVNRKPAGEKPRQAAEPKKINGSDVLREKETEEEKSSAEPVISREEVLGRVRKIHGKDAINDRKPLNEEPVISREEALGRLKNHKENHAAGNQAREPTGSDKAGFISREEALERLHRFGKKTDHAGSGDNTPGNSGRNRNGADNPAMPMALTVTGSETNFLQQNIMEAMNQIRKDGLEINGIAASLGKENIKTNEKELKSLSSRNVSLFVNANLLHEYLLDQMGGLTGKDYEFAMKAAKDLKEITGISNYCIARLAREKKLTVSSVMVDGGAIHRTASHLRDNPDSRQLGELMHSVNGSIYGIKSDEQRDRFSRYMERIRRGTNPNIIRFVDEFSANGYIQSYEMIAHISHLNFILNSKKIRPSQHAEETEELSEAYVVA